MRSRRGRSWLLAQLHARGLAGPVALLAETHRPLAPLLSDLTTFLSPLIELVLGRHTLADLTSEEDIDRLCAELSRSRPDDVQSPG